MTYEKISSNQYFEAILQIRTTNEEILKATINTIKKEKSFISKIKKLKTGLDFYISSRKTAVKVAKYLKKRFGGNTKATTKLHSKNHTTGKEIKRVTICYTPPKFNKGEIVKHQNKILIITGFKNHTNGKDLLTGKKHKIPNNAKKLTQTTTQISKEKPQPELIHPETYQSTKPENKFKIQKKITVAIDGKKLWVIQ